MCVLNSESWIYVSIQKLRNTFLKEARCVNSRQKVGICCNQKSLTLKTQRKLSRRKVVNVCIQLTELHCCVYAVVCKCFLWRISKLTFPAKSCAIRNSNNTTCKTQKKRICETSLVFVHWTKRVRSTFLRGAAFRYTRVNGSKRGIEKYLLLKPKRSYITERSSMCAFNLQS